MAKQANALDLLRADHRKVAALFKRFERADDAEQQSIAAEAIESLRSHAAVEEEVFYPFVREATDSIDLAEEAEIEHAVAKDLMGQIEKAAADPLRRSALMKVLGEYVMHHVQEEEEQIFPVVERIGVDLDALGMEIAERKREAGRGNGRGRKSAPAAKPRRAGGRAGSEAAEAAHEPGGGGEKAAADEGGDGMQREEG